MHRGLQKPIPNIGKSCAVSENCVWDKMANLAISCNSLNWKSSIWTQISLIFCASSKCVPIGFVSHQFNLPWKLKCAVKRLNFCTCWSFAKVWMRKKKTWQVVDSQKFKLLPAHSCASSVLLTNSCARMFSYFELHRFLANGKEPLQRILERICPARVTLFTDEWQLFCTYIIKSFAQFNQNLVLAKPFHEKKC